MVGSKKYKKNLLIAWAVIMLLISIFPLVYMILNSFAITEQVDKKIIPTSFSIDSYKFLLTGGGLVARPWLNALFNSFFVAISTTILQLFIAMLVGYAITKLKFKGSKLVNNFILFQMFFPTVILLVPMFLVSKALNINNTYFGMIIPMAISAWAIFMYINYYKSLPDEVLEAARIDGAKELQIVTKIVFPMTKSITTILFLFLFMGRWSELMWDTIIVKKENLLTLNVLLASMKGPYNGYPGPLYAGAVLLTVPILILFILLSKRFTEGMNYVTK